MASSIVFNATTDAIIGHRHHFQLAGSGGEYANGISLAVVWSAK